MSDYFQEALAKSKNVHDDFYDYSISVYNGYRNKVKIICPIHGIFEQIMYNHIKGMGCMECGKEKTLNSLNKNKDTIIEKFEKIHGDTYDYSLVVYVNNKTKVKITCKIHGNFEQTPINHLKGMGCKDCGKIKISKTAKIGLNDFISKAKEIHGDTYDYTLSEYIGYKKKIKIICKDHGIFEQTPDNHLSGSGCRCCGFGKGSFYNSHEVWERISKLSNNFDSFKFYIIRLYNNEENFYKFGITYNTVKERARKIPYNYELVEVVEGNAKDIFEKEVEFSKKVKRYEPIIKFNGYSECFISLET